MSEIEIETKGLILEGRDAGWYLIIQDLHHGQGAYLILVTPSLKQQEFGGYDHWVENFQELQEYFKEAKWKICWSTENTN